LCRFTSGTTPNLSTSTLAGQFLTITVLQDIYNIRCCVQSTYKTKFQVLNAKKEAMLHMLTWKSPGSMLRVAAAKSKSIKRDPGTNLYNLQANTSNARAITCNNTKPILNTTNNLSVIHHQSSIFLKILTKHVRKSI